MRKSIFSFFAIFGFFAFIVGCSSDDSSEAGETGSEEGKTGSTSIMTHTKWPDDNFVSDNLRMFSEEVDKISEGGIELELNTGGQLGYEGPELLTAVKNGQVPISDIFTSEVGGDEPLFLLTTMPFLSKNYEEKMKLYDIARPYFETVLEEKWNQKLLFEQYWPFAGFYTKDKVESIKDMNNLKMRTYDKNGATVVESAGATPMPMPFSEVYSALSTGVIDSVLTSPTTGVDGKFWEVLNYFTPTNVTAGYSIVTMNLDEFNELSQEEQDALIQAGEKMNEKALEIVDNETSEMLNTLEENGLEMIEANDEFMSDLAEIGDEITNEWLENDAPPEAIEIIEKYRKEVGR